MFVHGWKKIMAVGLVISVIGLGLIRASESIPQFQEKESDPAVRKHKKFPVLLVLGGALVLGAVAYLATKKKKDNPTPPPVADVTYTFTVFDLMEKDAHKTFNKTVKVGSPVSITTTETDIGDVVADFISVQDISGKTLESSKTGTVTFTPGSDTTYKVIRYHNGIGFKEVYDWLAAQTSLQLYAGRESTFSRLDEDGVTGKESVWSGAGGVFPMMKEILNNPFKVGDVTVVSSNGQNKYGFWKKYAGAGGKDLSIRLIYANPTIVPEDFAQTKVGFIELQEYLGAFGDIFGKGSLVTFYDEGKDAPNDKAKAAARFIMTYCK
jgi:hypothetical protein